MYRGTFRREAPRIHGFTVDANGRTLRSGAAAAAATLRFVRRIFPAAHVAGKNDFILSAASAGNQEGAPAPSWNFPRTEDEGRKPPFRCLLLPVAPTIRLAAKRLRRRTPSPRRAITTQSQHQNYQALNDFVSPQDRDL